MIPPVAASATHPLARGVIALPGGFALLTESRVLLCADAHFGYEDVMGGALPLWSTAETAAGIAIAAQRHGVREIVFLGDLVHGSSMSAGAVRTVQAALNVLRGLATVTCVAGNHEGRTRGRAILGEVVESCERDGWTLLHGDKPPRIGTPAIVGHLHPSVHLGGDVAVPAFLAASALVVVPALTPYSTGLDVRSDACLTALEPYDVRRSDVQVVAATADRVYPFGTLSRMLGALRRPSGGGGRYGRRKVLRSDSTS